MRSGSIFYSEIFLFSLYFCTETYLIFCSTEGDFPRQLFWWYQATFGVFSFEQIVIVTKVPGLFVLTYYADEASL